MIRLSPHPANGMPIDHPHFLRTAAALLALLFLGSPGLPAVPAAVTATDFKQARIYHSPETPGYTSWCTLWRARDGHLRLAFQQVTGPAHQPGQRTNATVILDSPDNAASWHLLRTVPARKNLAASTNGIYTSPADSSFCGHGLAALPDGTLVTGLWAGGGFDSGFIQRSEDDGKTWSEPVFVVDPKQYQLWPTVLRTLSDGRLILFAGLWSREPGRPPNPRIGKAMFQSTDGGRTWGPPIRLMSFSAGVCEESDFAELPGGDLLFVHRTEHFDGDKYLFSDRWQGRVRANGKDWVPEEPTKAPFPHSGFPAVLRTREGVVLHVATDGVWWTGDDGKAWSRLSIPGSPYYPCVQQLTDGAILVVGHVGADDVYGVQDQSIVQQTFRLKVQAAP